MSLKNEKYKNKLENGRKKKFGKEFAEIPKGKHYVEELEPLLGAAVDLECDDWVFIPGDLGLEGEKEKYRTGIHGKMPIHIRGIVYEHKVFIDGINGKFVKRNIGFQCFSMWKVGDR